ncbi:MAG: HDOD domain-containing protein, partial [Deltaproteobacteria bacterium]|nr:HDOD domain-containing protein [Deltaproteobacteria bacterium]
EMKKISMFEAERLVLGLDHAEVGGWLAKSWFLPRKLVEPISCHHLPKSSQEEPLASAILHFSDVLIRGLGYGHGTDIWVPPLSKFAWDTLGLSAQDLDEILAQVEENLWEVKGFSLDIQSELVNKKQE